MSLLTLDPTIPSWVNAVTVVVLAFITWRYARSAKKQADASESQAKAAMKQAEAAERHLAILQSQIQEQAGRALATLKENIAELKQAADHWSESMYSWGQLTAQTGADLLPSEWLASLEHARRISTDLYQDLMTLQRLSRKVSLSINQFSAKAATYRSQAEAEEIKKVLLEISNRCIAISKKLGELS